jgi:Fic family protein
VPRSNARQYEKTHPFITFDLDLDPKHGVGPETWMLLGEARSKCDHLARVPMRTDTAGELYRIFLVKGVMATTAIEGNTLSEEEVAKRINGELPLPASKNYLGIEVDNIAGTVEGVMQHLRVHNRCEPLTSELLKDFNRGILKNLEGHTEEGIVPGEFRTHSVGVGLYRAAPAGDLEYLVDKMCEWLNHESFSTPIERRLERGILRAILAHLYIAWIHPFGDGNGRVARMVEWHQLLRAGVAAPAAFVLSNHYNITRTEYYRALQRSSTTPTGVADFISYALRGFVDGLRDAINIVHRQQQDLAWRDWLAQAIGRDSTGGTSPTRLRQHQLVLALSAKPMTRNEILAMAIYGDRTGKTLTRDLRSLTGRQLIRREGSGYIANKDFLYQLLPERLKHDDESGNQTSS